jgi:UDP-glucose 4-epimerase
VSRLRAATKPEQSDPGGAKVLEHGSDLDTPQRVVVLGAGGFVGGEAVKAIARADIPVLGLARADVDLMKSGAAERLAGLLETGDSLVVVSANAPCRDVCAAVAEVDIAHLVYVSSDAVYTDSSEALMEDSATMPSSMHGMMHVVREAMLREAAAETPFATLRPSLLYGVNDPHNGYGPNRFRRQAAEEGRIVLFGNGEERRDHVLINDLGELISRVVAGRSRGILNVATGSVMSFHEIAEIVAAQFDVAPTIETTPRSGSMPHNGYRPFDVSATHVAFPDFAYTQLDEGLRWRFADSLNRQTGKFLTHP